MSRFFCFVLNKTIPKVGTSISAAVKKIQVFICMNAVVCIKVVHRMHLNQKKNIIALKL